MTNPILDMLNERGKPSDRTNAPAKNGLPTSLNDPRMDEAKQYVQAHGGNPRAAFYQLCKEKMLNPANVINKILSGR